MSGPDAPIYLDHNGTMPVAPEVVEAMLPYLGEHYDNPSSTTPLGRIARAAIEQAPAEVAALMGARPEEIIFTGGGTEASNHFLIIAPTNSLDNGPRSIRVMGRLHE